MNARFPLLRSILAASLVASPGCVATQYQKASARTAPAILLNLPAAPSAPLRADLETVIEYDGPGSWKCRAFWDEYVVPISNVSGTRANRVFALRA